MAVAHITIPLPLGQPAPSPTQPVCLPPPDHEGLVLIKTTGYNFHGIILKMTPSYRFQFVLVMGSHEWSDKPLLLLATVQMVNGLLAAYKSAVNVDRPTSAIPNQKVFGGSFSPQPPRPLAPLNIPLEIFFTAGLRSDYRKVLADRHSSSIAGASFGEPPNWISQVLCMIPAEWYPEFAPAQYRTASGWYRPNGEGPF